MAQNKTITMKPEVWVELTTTDVSIIRLQNHGRRAIMVVATTGPAPTDISDHVELNGGQTIGANQPIAELWPGVAGAKRVWALSQQGHGTISVSHT